MSDATNLYRVTFNIPGCLPESDPLYFDSLEAARDHVREEWDSESHVPAGEPDAWRNEFGAPSDAYWDAIEALNRLEPGMGADHPIPGNAYRWNLESVDIDDECPDEEVARMYLGLGQDRDSVLEWIHGDKEDARLGALRAFLVDVEGVDASELEDIEAESYDSTSFDANGGTYRVLDDSEADAAHLDYTRETAWAFNASFLAGYMPDGIDADEIDAIRGDRCEDANTAILALVQAGPSSVEQLARDYASADGRGHALAGYDGNESEVEHAGQTWYLYRTN